MRLQSLGFQRSLCRVLLLTLMASSACKTETSPTFNGVTGDTLFTIEGGDVILRVVVIRPAAVATITSTNPASIDYTLTCRNPNSGLRWAFYYLREDGSARVFGGLGCLQTVLQARQSFGNASASESEFVRGHTVRFRLAVAADADALLNGGPYTYLGTRDIATWTFE